MGGPVEMVRCSRCGAEDVRLDQKDWCEQCVINVGRVAILLDEQLEPLVAQWLDFGYDADQLIAAVRLSLRDAAGSVSGVPLERRVGGEWPEPPSLFNEEEGPVRGNLRSLRGASGLSMDEVARRADVPIATLALWERGEALPTESDAEAAARLCNMFGAHPVFAFGLDRTA
jgi:DNA-binding XRE family transcriptional regulator